MYILNRLKWKYNNLFFIPTHIDIELNNNCNQKCLSCWHNGKPPFEIKSMPLGKVKDVILQAHTMGIKFVKFNLRGEPLLYNDLLEVLRYAKAKNLYTMINTNGIKINNNLDIFKHLDEIIVSVDSFYMTTYCRLHNCKTSDFYMLMENLKLLQKLKKDGEIKTKLKINIHINKYNLREDITEFMFKYRWFKFVVRNTMKREGQDTSIDIKKTRTKNCYHVSRRITVLSNGNVYPCCVCYNDPKDIRIGTNYNIVNSVYSLKRRSIKHDWSNFKTCKGCTSADNLK